MYHLHLRAAVSYGIIRLKRHPETLWRQETASSSPLTAREGIFLFICVRVSVYRRGAGRQCGVVKSGEEEEEDSRDVEAMVMKREKRVCGWKVWFSATDSVRCWNTGASSDWFVRSSPRLFSPQCSASAASTPANSPRCKHFRYFICISIAIFLHFLLLYRWIYCFSSPHPHFLL